MRQAWLVLLIVIFLGAPSQAQTDAFDLLERVRDAYQQADRYQDRGEIEVVGTEGELRRLRFETFLGDGVFEIFAKSVGNRRVLQLLDEEVVLHDLRLSQYQLPRSVSAGLFEVFGRDVFEALVVPALLTGRTAGLADPDGAALDGTVACDGSICHVLLMSRADAGSEWTFWVDHETFLIRQVEVTFRSEAGLGDALAEAGLGAPTGHLSAAHGTTTVRIRHEIGKGQGAQTQLGEARLVEQWEGSTDLFGLDEESPDPQLAVEGALPAFDDEVSVDLAEMVVRVVDRQGRPVLGLEAADFRVDFEGQDVLVVDVDWVSSDPAHRDEALHAELAEHGIVLPPEENLVVFFVQADPHPSRITGHLRTLPHAQDFLNRLQPNDWVAVVSFDSRLKLWLDFTRRHGEAAEAIEQAIRFSAQPRLRARRSSGPSLELDLRQARDVASAEEALEVLGYALQPLDGEKAMVYLGWGLGRGGKGGVKMAAGYGPAVRALNAAQTSVFVLDVTDAGYHSLEVGLKRVAAHTGGTYQKTSLFAERVTAQLAQTISGHYVIFVDRGALPEEGGSVWVKVQRKNARLLGDRFRIGGMVSTQAGSP